MVDFAQLFLLRRVYFIQPNLGHWPLGWIYTLRQHKYVSSYAVSGVVFLFFMYTFNARRMTWSHLRLIPDKLFKYLPVEHGGNSIFPLTFILDLGKRFHPYTKWSSFDHRSFFPHTEKFKLRIAVVEGNLQLLKVVLDRPHFSVNSPVTDDTKVPALGLAAMLGRMQVLEYLRDRGADLDAPDVNGDTPLMLAVVNRQYRALQFLVENGADLSARDKFGFTAFDKAVNRGWKDMEAYLQAEKQRPKRITVDPVTPTLDQFAYIHRTPCNEIVRTYDPRSYFIGQEYPYYENSQGLLICMFGNYQNLDIRSQLPKWTAPNPMDEKASTDQAFLGFGKIMQEKIDMADPNPKQKIA